MQVQVYIIYRHDNTASLSACSLCDPNLVGVRGGEAGQTLTDRSLRRAGLMEPGGDQMEVPALRGEFHDWNHFISLSLGPAVAGPLRVRFIMESCLVLWNGRVAFVGVLSLSSSLPLSISHTHARAHSHTHTYTKTHIPKNT